MSKKFLGNPCWYELTTSKGNLTSAENFYASILGWTFRDAGMEGFDYHLAQSGGDMVAGAMQLGGDATDMPPCWMTYFAVDDADAFVAEATAAGASLHREPADIPGTGRFALLADPQRAAFGILQPDMGSMSEADLARAERGEGAFDPRKPGHCNWNELMSTDPDAAFAFYSHLFGWTRGMAVDMGKMGSYQLFQREGTDMGGMMRLGDASAPHWLPYFGVHGAVSETIEAIKAAGGNVHRGPLEVPGGMYIAVAQDPQGAWFAVTGAAK
ncbi:MAG: VOC family protein [Rhodanobacter sp.]